MGHATRQRQARTPRQQAPAAGTSQLKKNLRNPLSFEYVAICFSSSHLEPSWSDLGLLLLSLWLGGAHPEPNLVTQSVQNWFRPELGSANSAGSLRRLRHHHHHHHHYDCRSDSDWDWDWKLKWDWDWHLSLDSDSDWGSDSDSISFSD